MDRDKQIREIACFIWDNSSLEEVGVIDYIAEKLYEAGYRKQSEGEWVSVEGDVKFKCSICDAEISTSWDYENDDMWGYCPCCGAKMKGGEG